MKSRSQILAHRLRRLGLNGGRNRPVDDEQWDEFIANLNQYILNHELPFAGLRRDATPARRISSAQPPRTDGLRAAHASGLSGTICGPYSTR